MAPRGTPTKVVGIRLTDDDAAAVEAAAGRAGIPVATWMREAAIAASGAVVTPPWWCDRCGQPIRKLQHGWLQWRCELLPDESFKCDRIEIVHHSQFSPLGEWGCYPQAGESKKGLTWSDHHLDHFTGPTGLVNLLRIWEDNPPPEVLIDIMLRLYVPQYERARCHLPQAIASGLLPAGTKTIEFDLIQALVSRFHVPK